jgi:hypothetical protein
MLAFCFGSASVVAPRAAYADAQTVKLIQLLIQKGILTPGQAKDLLKESAPAPAGRRAPAAPALESEEAPPTPAGQIRVTYVPQFVRKQIADEVRAQVMDQAQAEGWAAPDALPEWTKRVRIIGDLRMRYRADMFDNNNYNDFVNFNSINNGSAFDASSFANDTVGPPPFLNTTENRNRYQLRARFGVQADIDDWVTAEIRAGTGQDDGPVSTNQTLGTATSSLGASGDFGKPELWLDRAFVTLRPLSGLTIYAGRMDNPFLPSDLMFYPDLGFDGVAANYTRQLGDNLTLFTTGGIFPLFNTSFDFSTDSNVKYSSMDSYLAALQAGATWRINPQLKSTLGIGLFNFLGVQGAVSEPCTVQVGGGFICNTDSTRTPYVQFGNTLYPIRGIVPEDVNNPPDPQYYGLASRFDVLDIHPSLAILTYDPIDILLEGQFIKNLAYDRAAILAHGAPYQTPGPVNNVGSIPKGATVGPYVGGDTGYMLKATVGQPEMHKRWDWNVFLSYRYLDTDATLDAIADSDFHEGGTDAQGYIVGGDLGIARNTWLTLRLMEAQAISGPHYGTEQVFLDLQTRF